MITLATVLSRVQGIDAATLEIWIEQDWLRPTRLQGAPVFEEIDIARLNLILELRDQLAVDEAAIPVVLSLLDQLHTTRARLQRLCEALEATPDRPARDVIARLSP